MDGDRLSSDHLVSPAQTHLGPGLQDGQRFHGSRGLVVQLTDRLRPDLDFIQRGGQELMDAPEVAEVADYAAGNPGAADLERMGSKVTANLDHFVVTQQPIRCTEPSRSPDDCHGNGQSGVLMS